MPNALVNALNRKLAAYEAAGMTEQAKRVKSRLAAEEKAAAKAASKSEPESKSEPSKTTAKKES